MFFNAFAEKDLKIILNNCLDSIKSEIDQQPENYILNVNEIDYVKYLVDKYSIENVRTSI